MMIHAHTCQIESANKISMICIFIFYINTLEGNINWIFCPKMKKRPADKLRQKHGEKEKMFSFSC